ncbi:hypothetical protein [Kribbella sp. NPDC049227]|uniref:hypothetical protein n=1 Tax=Kribbella sp. NPDC049227 TaxID=3364113 RepID=UPI003717B78B
MERTFNARALVVEVAENYSLPYLSPGTSRPEFKEASAGRSSDLSVKRNLGLLLGLMRGWNKIMFVDDDISRITPLAVARMTGHLNRHPVASMISRYFPDNSVVCHARRLAGFKQDVFVSGATLGVNLREPGLSFFADIYNEDWFFFARHAAARSLPKVGEVRQAKYEPFGEPTRADQEEFGDLLAEGLYAIFDNTPGWTFEEQLAAAKRPSYWEDFTEIRLALIDETLDALAREQPSVSPVDYLDMLDAQQSLQTAKTRAASIPAKLCVEFVMQWQEDEASWQRTLQRDIHVRSEPDALADLGLSTWTSCGFGTKPARRRTRFRRRPDLGAV